MKMLRITKRVTSDFFTQTKFLSAFPLSFIFPIWVYVYAVFSKASLDSCVSCHSYAKI